MGEIARHVNLSTKRTPVYLRVYDISCGAARTWSPILLGRRVEGVWHTGIEVYGYEYFYGGGIVKMRPENVEKTFGISPAKKHHLGDTEQSRIQFETHLQSIRGMFRKDVYDLVNWNCNHFSDHCSKRLIGNGIPEYIVDLPNEICKTFMGKLILNFIKMLQGGAAPIGVDDPEHPSKTLNVPEKRPRRSSCPASPSSVPHRTSAADTSIYMTNPNASTVCAVLKPPATARPLRHTHRHRTTVQLRLADHSKREGIERIPGATLGGIQTEIFLSPKHKQLYEKERDRFVQMRPTNENFLP